jgi:aryl-alcohol dehydrogenase-like predicted oxidoreductase
MYYSLVGRDIEHEVLPMARELGIGTMVWGPLAGGFLSGKYTPDTLKNPEHRLSGFDFLPFDKERGFELISTMKSVAAQCEATVAQVALAWLLAKPGVSTVLIGASKVSQLEDNLRAIDITLTQEQLKRLDDASPHSDYYPSWFTERLADPNVAAALQP